MEIPALDENFRTTLTELASMSIDEQTRLWSRITDIFVGTNEKTQNIPLALVMAEQCSHPDAQWLFTVFKKRGPFPRTVDEATRILYEEAQITNDARAWTFAAVTPRNWDASENIACLRRGADLGCTYAYPWLGTYTNDGQKRFWFAWKSVQTINVGSVAGWYLFGLHFNNVKEISLARLCLKRAAELDDVCTQTSYGLLFGPNSKQLIESNIPCCAEYQPECFLWLGRAVLNAENDRNYDITKRFVTCCNNVIKNYVFGTPLGPTIFQIGESLQNGVRTLLQPEFLDDVTLAASMHKSCCSQTMRAAMTWCFIANRLKVVHDIRRKIAKLIWESRREGLYQFTANGEFK